MKRDSQTLKAMAFGSIVAFDAFSDDLVELDLLFGGLGGKKQ